MFEKKLLGIFCLLFLAQFFFTGLLLYYITRQETTKQLTTLANRVKEDISFRNGKWDTSRYNADPELPGTYPLYVLATDGFVIDRWKPLHGFLDTSDAKRLLSYTTPQTISTDTDQSWRLLSKPISINNENVGVLTVASFNPVDKITDIDTQLTTNANAILAKITVQNGKISTKNLDVRDISYDVIFQIVDSYNKIITKTDNTNSIDRIPNFIDTSYIGNLLQAPKIQEVQDTVTNERFLLYTLPITDKNTSTIGVIVVGESIAFINTMLQDYAIEETLFGIILYFVAFLFVKKVSVSFAHHYALLPKEKPEITTISFDKKKSILLLGENVVHLPYATNQYYLCEALFQNAKKRWEADELLEKFGELESTNRRKIYDAMNGVNKKVAKFLDTKLIINTHKTYQLNPLLTSKIS